MECFIDGKFFVLTASDGTLERCQHCDANNEFCMRMPQGSCAAYAAVWKEKSYEKE